MAKSSASFFKQNILFLGIIASLQMKAEITSLPKSHNSDKTSAFSEITEKREAIKVQPLQNEVLKKLQELIACSSDQKDLSVEALSSKIKEALKPSASKFLDQQSQKTIPENEKESPLSIDDLEKILKNKKLSSYFNKAFNKLSENQTAQDYRSILISYPENPIKNAQDEIFEKIHKKGPSISKVLTEAAQEIKASSQKNQFVCEAKTKDLEIKILQKEKELKEAEKAVKEAATDRTNRDVAGKTYDTTKAKLEDLKKEAELNKAKILLQSVKQPSEIKEELLKKFPIKEDISPEQVVDMKFKSEDIKNKETKLKKAQKEYTVANEFFTNATKPNSDTDLKNSNILENRNKAESVLTQAKKEFDEAQVSRKELGDLEKYASTIKSIEESFQELVLNPDSKSSQEVLKYIKKKAPSLLDREGKIKYATSDEIKEVKKVLLEKLTEKSLMEKATEGAKDLLFKFRYDPTK